MLQFLSERLVRDPGRLGVLLEQSVGQPGLRLGPGAQRPGTVRLPAPRQRRRAAARWLAARAVLSPQRRSWAAKARCLAMTALRVIRRVRSLRYERAPRRRDDDQPLLGQKGNRAPRCSDADAVLLGDLADAGDLLARQPLARADALAQRRANSPVWRFCSAHGADARWLTIIAPGYRAIRIDRMLSMSPGWTQPVGGAMRELAVTGMAPASEQSYLRCRHCAPSPKQAATSCGAAPNSLIVSRVCCLCWRSTAMRSTRSWPSLIAVPLKPSQVSCRETVEHCSRCRPTPRLMAACAGLTSRTHCRMMGGC